MDPRYYREYYFLERRHWYFRARNKIIGDFIGSIYKENLGPVRILNVGVGTGYTSELLSSFGAVKSVEYDEDCYDFVVSRLNLDIELGSILNLPFEDNAFDLVCAFDVIEHVAEDQRAVDELIRVCATGGNIVITVPALMILWSHHDVVNHHFRRYKIRDVKTLFKYDFEYASYYNFFLFFPILVFRLLNRTVGLTKKNAGSSSGSDFEVITGNTFISRLLFAIFGSESLALRRRIRLPCGVSILLHAKKR